MNVSLATSCRWRDATLQDLVFFQRGYDITKAQQHSGNIPVISSSGITSFHNEAKAQGPGVVIGRKGTLGSVHYSAQDYWPHDTTLWSRDLRGNIPRFVYYFLHTIDFKRFDVGNSNPTLNRNHIHALPIKVPPLDEQESIASILCTYDDLIENNRRRMALLEEAARQLYREWFVRLRFPGHEHTRIIDGMPEGWERTTFGDLCCEIRETVNPEALDPETAYIGLEHLPRRSIALSEWGTAEQVTSSKHRFAAGDVLFGKIRPYFHKVGIAFVDGVASSDAIVLRPYNPHHLGFVLMTASSDPFVATTAQTMREGSKMPRADWKQMRAYPAPLPPPGLLDSFQATTEPILEQLRTLTFANQKLRTARDLILPRLMSGEIAV